MAAKVNTKFVVVLSLVSLLCVGGLAAITYVLLQNSGADLARMGDKKMAEGDYKEAAEIYSKAVNKEKTNPEILRKWIEALKQTTPETPRAYSESFYRNLVLAMRQLALVSRDIGAQREYLEMRHDLSDANFYQRETYDELIADTNLILQQYPTPSPESESLRRFRGLASLKVAVNSPDVSKELVDGTKADLEAALTADPADEDVAQGLSMWYALMASKALIANTMDEAKAQLVLSRQVITDFLAKNPKSVTANVIALRQDLESVRREVALRPQQPTMEELRQLSDAYAATGKPKLDAVAELAKADAANLPDQAVMVFRELERSIDGPAGLSRTESIIRTVLQARPNDAEMLQMLSEIVDGRREHSDAVAILQQIVDMPVPPLSIEGQVLFDRKNQAMFRQSQSLYQIVKTAKTAEERDAAVAQIKKLRENMASIQDTSTPALVMMDAQLAVIGGDLTSADRLLAQFNKATNHNVPDGLMLAADVSIMRNELGAAKQHLETLVRKDGSNMAALVRLADVEQALKNFPRALELYKSVREQIPPEAAKAISEQIAVIEGITMGGKVSDPVLQVIIDADNLMRTEGGKPGIEQKVVAFIRGEIDRLKSTDPRLFRALALAQVRANNREGAVAAIDEGLTHNPGSTELKMFKVGISQQDPLQARLDMIELRAADDPVERSLGRFTVFNDAGKKDEAAAELANAVKLSPNDKRVIEVQFLDALARKSWTEAEELAARGQREDVDGTGGDTLRARLEVAKGNGSEGVRIMEQAVAKGGAKPETYRLLGHMQNGIGRNAEAVASFKEALRLRPNDIPIINDLIATLINMRRGDEALLEARAKEPVANVDATFVHMWLNLEAALGNRPMVVQRRSNLFRINPEDRENAIALAVLYMDAKQFAEARPVIDYVRSKYDGLDAVSLDAGWYWAQRDFDKAKQVFEGHIAAIDPSKMTADPLVSFAQFLLQRQDIQGGLSVLERARQHQDPKTANVDRSLADTYFTLGRYEDTVQACQRILDAGADTPQKVYRKRMVESYLAMGKMEEANRVLSPMLTGGESDAVTMLLAAQVRKGQNDLKGQREMLDRAVERFPKEAQVFMRRGQAMIESSQDPVVIRDAIADFTKAVQLNPSLWQALRMRALAYESLKETERAIADLRQALEVNPFDNELLGGLIAFLLKENRDQDAFEIANRTLDKRQRDAAAHIGVAQIFATAERWNQAIRYMERAFTIDNQDGIAQRYLDTLMSAKPPQLTQAEKLLTTPPLKDRVAGNPGLLMAKARLEMGQNRSVESLRSARDALALMNTEDPRQMITWWNEAKRLLPDGGNLGRFLQELANSGVATEWLAFFRASLLLEDVATQSQGIEVLKDLLTRSQNKPLRQFTHRALTGALYNSGLFDQAAAAMQAALSEFPDDLEVMNNLAYTLAKRLNQAQQALPLAEKVVLAKPTADAIDTLAMCHLLLGKPDEALTQLNRAAAMDMSPSTAVSVAMHQAEALLSLKRMDEAKAAFANAQKIAENNPSAVSTQTKADLAELSKRMGTP